MGKFLRRLLVFVIIVIALPVILFSFWIHLTPFSIENLPPLKNGDLVFQTIKAPQSLAISFATASPYTHIGMIKMHSDSKPLIVEAVGPVREIPLTEWIRQGIGSRITIYRIKNLTESDAEKVLQVALSYYGKPYDFYFLPDNQAIYCSELVYKSFSEGSHILLGKEQAVKELNVNNFAVRDLIKERWESYPACHGYTDFESCYKVILQQKLVSPASIATDPNVELIYSDYGIFK